MTLAGVKNSAVIVFFVCTVCLVLLTPVRDEDFFWHLATGRWIAEHRELPVLDPFAYTTAIKEQEDFYRAKIVLTQYWIAELFQYGIFSVGGGYGIIVLRVLIVLLTLLILGAHMRKKGLGATAAVLLLFPVFFVLQSYQGDRPNQMTFLFAALFMFLADALRRGERKGRLLPLVMLVWANCHGGFVLGAVIAAVMAAAELLRKVFLKGHQTDRVMVTVLLATLGAGFLNPNGYNIIYSMLYESSAYYNSTIWETGSPWSFTVLGWYSYMWTLGICLCITVWYFIWKIFSGAPGVKDKILDVSDELMLVGFLGVISFTAIRYIPVLVLVSAPVSAPLFAGRFQGLLRRSSSFLLPELAIAAVSVWWIYGAFPATVLKLPPEDPFFPEDAVQFIKEKNMEGRFYNYYDWGGYLIWRFYPRKFVFIDGRGISLGVYSESNAIINNDQRPVGKRPLYSALLDAYSVQHLLIPAVDASGEMYPILDPLVADPEWRLIFVGKNSLIYSRDKTGPAYQKTFCYNLALSNALEIIAQDPDNPFPYLTFASANDRLGRHSSAMRGLEEALRNRPALRGGPVEIALEFLREGKEIPPDILNRKTRTLPARGGF